MGRNHDKKRRTWIWPSPLANSAPAGHALTSGTCPDAAPQPSFQAIRWQWTGAQAGSPASSVPPPRRARE
jgi:hypothetical protein